MSIVTSPVFYWNYQSDKRITINQGGTSSGKTYAILQVLAIKAIRENKSLTTVTASSFPTLRKGALRDFIEIAQHEAIKPFIVNHDKSSNTFKFFGGAEIEFAIFPTAQDAKNGKRERLFINEADGIGYAVAQNLILRTSGQIFIDFNPTSFFWCHEKYKGRDDCKWIYSTYRDNPFVSDWVIEEIESLKIDDPELYKVYGLGKFGKMVGMVYPNVNWIDDLPPIYDARVFCMDIGFSQSFTTLIDLRLYKDQLYGREMLYERGLNDKQIAETLVDLNIPRHERLIIDSANKMLIDYLVEEYGFNAISCAKRNVISEINSAKRFKINITDDSENWKKEQRNYLYQKDSDNNILNTPIKNYDHLWDAFRYGFLDLVDVNSLPTFN
jgi:phage terminase large subunit